jgi:hypothetical protein
MSDVCILESRRNKTQLAGKKRLTERSKNKTLAKLASKFIKLLANSKFHSHLASWRVVISTSDVSLQPLTDPAASVGRAHARAIHELRATQRPVGHRGDGSARSADAHTQSSVVAWAARRPRVVHWRHALTQGVLCHHHLRCHVRSNACKK